MVPYLGDFSEDQSVFVAFNTFDSNDPSASVTITNLADTDIHIHKDDGTTQHSSATDVDVQIDFDGITGNHMVEIRTTNAFFTTGADYFVRMEGTTVDGATINAWIGHFSIENRHSAGALRPTTAGRTLDINATGEVAIDLDATSGALGTADFDADFLAASLIADNAFVAANFAASSLDGKGDWNTTTPPTAAAIADQVWNEDATGHQTAGTFGEALGDPLATGNSIRDLVSTVDTVVDGIQTDLDNGTDGLGAIKTAVDGLNDLSTADVDARLAAIGLDHLINSALPTSWAVDVAAGSVFDQVADDGTAVYDRTTDSLQAIADSGGGGPTAAQIADAVWDEDVDTSHQTAGTAGKKLDDAGGAADPWATALPGAYGAGTAGKIIGDNIDAPISTVDTVVDGIQTDLDNGTDGLGAIKTAVDAIPTSNPSAASIADAVWDEAATGHTDAGKAGEQLWTDVDAILADTNELQTDDVPGLIATAQADLDTLTGTDGATLATAQGNYAPAKAGDEMDLVDAPNATALTAAADALLKRDMSAVTGEAARSPLNALRFLRNKWSISGTTLTVTKEDDSTSAWTSTVSTDAAADPVTASDPA